MTKPQRVKLIRVYTRRAECYMRMAERFNKMRYANLAWEDSIFVFKNDILMADITADQEDLGMPIKIVNMKSEEFIANRKIPKNNQENNVTTSSRNNNNNNGSRRQQRRNNNRRTRNNNNRPRQQRASNTENKENQEDDYENSAIRIEDEDGPLLAYTCSKIKESNLAINALSEDDQCPICQMQWINFVDPTIAVILPCSHACMTYFFFIF